MELLGAGHLHLAQGSGRPAPPAGSGGRCGAQRIRNIIRAAGWRSGIYHDSNQSLNLYEIFITIIFAGHIIDDRRSI